MSADYIPLLQIVFFFIIISTDIFISSCPLFFFFRQYILYFTFLSKLQLIFLKCISISYCYFLLCTTTFTTFTIITGRTSSHYIGSEINSEQILICKAEVTTGLLFLSEINVKGTLQQHICACTCVHPDLCIYISTCSCSLLKLISLIVASHFF